MLGYTHILSEEFLKVKIAKQDCQKVILGNKYMYSM